jgi:Arc/MetJ family transcription regulator
MPALNNLQTGASTFGDADGGARCGPSWLRYPWSAPKTSVEVDPDILQQAAEILGTTTLRATIDAALREIDHAQRRLELIALLGQDDRFDFRHVDRAWGSDE